MYVRWRKRYTDTVVYSSTNTDIHSLIFPFPINQPTNRYTHSHTVNVDPRKEGRSRAALRFSPFANKSRKDSLFAMFRSSENGLMEGIWRVSCWPLWIPLSILLPLFYQVNSLFPLLRLRQNWRFFAWN